MADNRTVVITLGDASELTLTYQPHFLPRREVASLTVEQEVHTIREVWDLKGLTLYHATQATLFDDFQDWWNGIFNSRSTYPTKIEFLRATTAEFTMSTTTHEDLTFSALLVSQHEASGQTVFVFDLQVVGTLKLADSDGIVDLQQSFSRSFAGGLERKRLESKVTTKAATDITGKYTLSLLQLTKPSSAVWVTGDGATNHLDILDVEGRDSDTEGRRSCTFVSEYEETDFALPSGVDDFRHSVTQTVGAGGDSKYTITAAAIGSGAQDWLISLRPAAGVFSAVVSRDYRTGWWEATYDQVGIGGGSGTEDVAGEGGDEEGTEPERESDRPKVSVSRSVRHTGGGKLGPQMLVPIPPDRMVFLRATPRPLEITVTTRITYVGKDPEGVQPPAPVLEKKYLVEPAGSGGWSREAKSQDPEQDVWTTEVVRTYRFPAGEEPTAAEVFRLTSQDVPEGGWNGKGEWE